MLRSATQRVFVVFAQRTRFSLGGTEVHGRAYRALPSHTSHSAGFKQLLLHGYASVQLERYMQRSMGQLHKKVRRRASKRMLHANEALSRGTL